jgi:hypothetical protein
LIEARLGEHPEWADRLTTNKLGCSDMTVKGTWGRKSDRLLGADGRR